MSEAKVKIYMIKGNALFNESKFPTMQKFTKYVRALNEKQAIEYVYSYLGSKNKIKRYNIKIQEIKEVNENEVTDRRVKDIAKLDKIIM
ncbi:50S ribosomal protein L18a [Acidianus sulfidivorans JP7]|uniref:Large ribosomal subunit protein eL20 n=1 Tax=Acidianus sulfidivorans JP7 TaxID=619593 RepID=A0A2U9INX3_9CREN|nr:50S ribosomal protein L18Ae [Acidianus sulfidivorans]AWR97712.1 50S ribosomal protein L18a [Acidianus sulfidivorans JP7]